MCFSAAIPRLRGREDEFSKELGLKSKLRLLEYPEEAKLPYDGNRFYSKVWAPVLIEGEEGAELKPMRYQLLPSFCKGPKYTRINPKTGRKVEIKDTFNARIDGLETRKAWSPLFGKKHAAIPIQAFFEWVPHNGKAREISFKGKDIDHFWVACLWDRWESKGKFIESFAMITDEPRPEVLEAGHDRTPIILDEDAVKFWINPQNESREELYEILEQRKSLYLESALV